ncbi:hypothetical protein [Natrinema sp. H-ect4]
MSACEAGFGSLERELRREPRRGIDERQRPSTAVRRALAEGAR